MTSEREVRAKNLRHILDIRFKGKKQAFADAIQVSPVTLQKYLNAASDRACNEKAARKIERKLGLKNKYLDRNNYAEKNVYYIALYTDAQYSYEIITTLHKDPSIKECSVVLGEIDILIKAETSTEKLPQLISFIAKFPGIKKVSTYHSIHKLRWQRAQSEDTSIIKEEKNKTSSNKGLEKFIHRKIEHHFDQIKELGRGEIIAGDNDILPLKSYQIIEGAERSIYVTTRIYISDPPSAYKKKMLELEEYLSHEKRLIRNKKVKIKRIILVPENYKQRWGRIKKSSEKFFLTGSEIRFLSIKGWIANRFSQQYEQFFIIDNDFVCIRSDEKETLTIRRIPEIVDTYKNTFIANWDKSESADRIDEDIFDNSGYS